MRSGILAFALAAAGTAYAAPESERLINVKSGDKWGVLDQSGRTILPIDFDFILIRDDNLISAKKDGASRYYDLDGKEVWSGYAYVSEPDRNGNRYVQVQNRKTGLVDRNGREILPAIFGYVTPFDNEGHYVVHYKGQAIVIGLDMKPIIQKTFFYVSTMAPNGLAVAKTDLRNYGAIDSSGNWVIAPGAFEEIHDFDKEGLAAAKSGGKWGFIDRTGQWVVKPISDDLIWLHPFNRLGTTPVKIGSKWGFIDRSGKVVVKPVFDQIGFWNEADGTYVAQINGNKGLIDGKGRFVLEPIYTNFTAFHEEGLAAAWQGTKSFVINRKGQSVFGEKFEQTGGFFGGGWAAARSGGKWGAIDTRGNWIIRPAYQCVSICFDGTAPPPVFTPAPLDD